MTISTEQKIARQSYLGASDAPLIVLGQLYGKSVYDLWQEKTGKKPNSFEGNMSTKLGDALEPFIGEQAQEQLGKRLYRAHQTVFHKDFDFIACNLDFRIGRSLPMVPVEAKFTGDRSVVAQPKVEHIIQVMTQIACTGAGEGYIAYLVEGLRDKAVLHRIVRDEDAVENLIETLCHFWYGNVLSDTPPRLLTNSDVNDWFGTSQAIKVEADETIAAKVARLGAVRSMEKELEAEDDALALDIKRAIGSGDTLIYQGKPIATWKSAKDSAKFDLDALLGDLIGYAIPSPADRQRVLADWKATHVRIERGSRRLLLKGVPA